MVSTNNIAPGARQALRRQLFRLRTRVYANLPAVVTIIIFLMSFVAGLYFAYEKFPPSVTPNPVHWVLAYSIFVSALSGFGVLLIEMVTMVHYNIVRARNPRPVHWRSSTGFTVYILITATTVVSALYFIDKPARTFASSGLPHTLALVDNAELGKRSRLGLHQISTDYKSEGTEIAQRFSKGFSEILGHLTDEGLGGGLKDILMQLGDHNFMGAVWYLEKMAIIVVFLYLIADVVGYKYGNHSTFLRIIYVDIGVLCLHGAALLVIYFGPSIWILREFHAAPREAFMGGFMGLALISQSAFFAYIMARAE